MRRSSKPIWPGSNIWSRKAAIRARLRASPVSSSAASTLRWTSSSTSALPRRTTPTSAEALAALRGKVAIANAKLAYQRYKRLFAGARWEKLQAKGARVQRLLWASTGTKNKDYSDVLYVEELIAADTVNTMPPATMDAFRDHGKVRASLEENIEQAKQTMAALDRSGISIDAVTAKLVEEGVQLFADAFDKLLGAVARKRAANLGEKLDGQTYKLPAELEKTVAASLEVVAA